MAVAQLAIEIEQTVLRVLAELRPANPLYTNVEFYAGVVMDRCGLPRELFTPTFAVSRVISWCASNRAEQAAATPFARQPATWGRRLPRRCRRGPEGPARPPKGDLLWSSCQV